MNSKTVSHEISCRIFMLLTFFSFLCFSLQAQEKTTVIPQVPTGPDSSLVGKKSSYSAYGYVSSWNGSYYSDYYIYFQWSGYYFQCDCSSGSYKVKLTIDGVDYWPGSFSGSTYSGYGCKVGLGPGRNGTCSNVNYEGGNHTYFLFGCLNSCSANWHSTSPRYYSTAGVRPPVNPIASREKYDYRIDLSWDKTTDIPDAEHGYLVKRDGVEIAKLFNGKRTFSDTGLGPDEEHTYTIHTIWPDAENYSHISGGVSVTGSTFDLGLTASGDESASVNLSWTSLSGIPGRDNKYVEYYKVDRYDEVRDKLTTIPGLIDTSTTNYPDESATLIPGFMYQYVLRPYPEEAFYPDTAWGKILPDGRIKGKVISPTGRGVSNIRVCAVRLDTVPQDTTTRYCAVTDTAGTFEIRNIYYYLESKFRLIPSREGHGFDPVYEEPSLYLDNKWLDGIVFTDTSAFTISGEIVQQGNKGLCPVKNVGIYVNGKDEPETFTNEEGIFSFSVGQIDNYSVMPKLEGHHFVPAQREYLVNSDTITESFTDTTKFKLSGFVRASCGIYIGRALMGISSGNDEEICLDTVVATDTLTGYYEIVLPAGEYSVSLLQFESEDDNVLNEDVESYFPVMEADLTFGDAELNMIYRSEPLLEITGFPEFGCGEYEGIPILGQGYGYTLDLKVSEVFGEQVCPADTGYVVVYNHLGEKPDQTDTLYLNKGIAEYSFVAGEPNLIAPHLKNLTVTAHISNESVTGSVDVLVTGNRPREKTFTTVSPEIPFLILRDPPGDASYSYLEENTTTETAVRFSALESGSVNAWAEVKAGTKFESGFGVTVETEIWGSVRSSLEVGATITRQDEFTLSITNGEIFSTSGNQDITGESGDVFAGSALNMIYALTDVISFDRSSCEVVKSVSLSMGVDGFATTFIYTENHIRNVLIPQLMYLRNLYSKEDNDSARIYADQVDVWRQTLKLNDDLKMQSKFIENRSFSSGAGFESYQEIASTDSKSLEFSMYIDAGIAAEAGVEVGGVGVSGGVEVKFRTEIGLATGLTEMKSRKTGFVLNDDDGNDYFSIDILADKVFGTPVFNLVSGTTSCPWEPGTQPREGVNLVSDSYVAEMDDPNGQAVFHLQLGNISQSDEDMIYNLIFDQASNPEGAVITIGGSPVQGGVPTPYYIPAGASKEATVTVRRGPESFDYDNLMFILTSGCLDPAIADSVALSVHFESPCSEIVMSKPLDQWHLSSVDDNRLKVKLEGYDRDMLDFIKVQVAQAGTNNWQTIAFLEDTDLDPVNTETYLHLDQFNDREYDLRAQAGCAAGLNYSGTVRGVIDRMPPEPYGLPEPSDLVLDSSDIIMVVFNEDINCIDFVPSMVEVKNLSENKTVNAQIGCYGNTLILIPELTGNSFAGDTFNIKLMNVEDVYGNVREQDLSWSFIMNTNPMPASDADTDMDGIKNAADNCPWAFNSGQEDMDSDGKGDMCDDDIDGDLFLNYEDNCPMHHNPDQKDEDGDGFGDACQTRTDTDPGDTAAGFELLPAIPNPFGEQTMVHYNIPHEAHVNISIYNISGSLIHVAINENVSPGIHHFEWDASGVEQGIYYCRMNVKTKQEGIVLTKTIKLVKIN